MLVTIKTIVSRHDTPPLVGRPHSADIYKVCMEDFEDFVGLVQARLSAGAKEYGDRSFSRHPMDLMNEIQEELLDICGWSYVLFTRLKKVQNALQEGVSDE